MTLRKFCLFFLIRMPHKRDENVFIRQWLDTISDTELFCFILKIPIHRISFAAVFLSFRSIEEKPHQRISAQS